MAITVSAVEFLMCLMFLIVLPICVVAMIPFALIWCIHVFFDHLGDVVRYVRNQQRYLMAWLRFYLEEAMFSTPASIRSGIFAALGLLSLPLCLAIGFRLAYRDFGQIDHIHERLVTVSLVMLITALSLWLATQLCLPHAFVCRFRSFGIYPRWRSFIGSFILAYGLLSYCLTWLPTLGSPGIYVGLFAINVSVPIQYVYGILMILSFLFLPISLNATQESPSSHSSD